MWEKFFAMCDCVPLNRLPEADEMFAGFEPIDSLDSNQPRLA
jgi:hypothetical protein